MYTIWAPCTKSTEAAEICGGFFATFSRLKTGSTKWVFGPYTFSTSNVLNHVGNIWHRRNTAGFGLACAGSSWMAWKGASFVGMSLSLELY